MSKDLADKKDQYEKLRVSMEEREQTLEAKKVQLAVLLAEFDRTAALVSPKEENADGECKPVPGSVLLHDIDNFKKENPEAEDFLASPFWEKLQAHIRVMPKETAPDDSMGDSAGDDAARASTGGGAPSDNGAAAAGAVGADAGRAK
eukprot:1194097-Pyramimonas_sp.AAC.1